MKVSRILLQSFFEAPLPSGEELAEKITFHSFEVEGVEKKGEDDIIDIDILPNRSSDCLSHRGIAFELHTILNIPLKKDPLRESLSPLPPAKTLSITRDKNNVCTRYCSAVLRDIVIEPSPLWMQEILSSLGQKPINNVVDATNYTMLLLGNPLHAFDADKISTTKEGVHHIEIRPAKENEKITTLSGETYTLTENDTLITDGLDDRPLAIAGIKGGKNAEIDKDTKNIILESAHFAYTPIRKTSQRLRLSTESSLRFQNDPSPLLCVYALHFLISLLKEITKGVLMGAVISGEAPPIKMPLHIKEKEINALLGTHLSVKEIEDILLRLGCDFSKDEGGTFTVSSPWERTDLHTVPDFIEEIGRVYGYRKIKGILPPLPLCEKTFHKETFYTEKIKKILTERGYNEIYTYTLKEKGERALLNPLASDKAFLRSSLEEGMREALSKNVYNAPQVGLHEILSLFEIGTVWKGKEEYTFLSFGIKGMSVKQKKCDEKMFEDKIFLEKECGEELECTFNEGIFLCNLTEYIKKLPENKKYDEALPFSPLVRFNEWSPFPHIVRDIAVWVPEGTPEEKVRAHIIVHAPSILLRYDLFDTFTKENQVSYAWHLVFQSKEKTLTDEEVNTHMERMTKNINSIPLWSVR
jgi:phenylalanyl-tRNA synthetase beta subunit